MYLIIKEQHAWINSKEEVAFAVYKRDRKGEERISGYCNTEQEAREVLETFKKELIAKAKTNVIHTEKFEV